MAEAVPAVALLFDDGNLGQQLRSALQERGARIVHEGPLKGLSRDLLVSLDADVLVVNLDDEDDSALDRLDESLVGDRPRVVFNDGQASRRLEGWDRARWARHLAMKVLAMGDADPPRPPAADQPSTEASDPAPIVAPEPMAVPEGVAPEVEEARQAAVSETLAAELEALLASDAAVTEADEFGAGLNYEAGEGALLHDGIFEAAPAPMDAVVADGKPEAGDEVALGPGAADPTVDDLQPPALESPALAMAQPELLQLAPDAEAAVPAATRLVDEPAATPRASDSWTLYDHDASPVAPVERADPAVFGIEKLSAADYLAPDADADADAESPIHPGFSLELVSMEEAIAPQDFERGHEMVLELPDSAVSRLVVLGATTESTASVGEFLAALPAGLRATVLHTQHLAGRAAEGLAEYLASQCALPVRVAEAGMRARAGEVIVVPSDRQVALRRDGSIELQPIQEDAVHAPSIDVSFTQAAAVFGRDLIAIVFAGRSTDAVGGCQAVYDRGGQVWVEAAGGAQAADMVSGVLAEHLSHHAGSPRELAARLAEQFTEGQP